jgi:hypothetical protein
MDLQERFVYIVGTAHTPTPCDDRWLIGQSKKLVRAGPRAGRPRPEAPGPTYLFKNNNKNFTTFLLLLVSRVLRGGGGGAPRASVCLLKEKGARKFTLNCKKIPIFLINILILSCFFAAFFLTRGPAESQIKAGTLFRWT